MRIKCIVAPLVAVTALGLLAACESSGASEGSTLGVGYFQSATIGPEVLVAGNPELADKVDGTFKLTPIDSGVAGLARLRGGAFPFVSGVGNPPVVGSIAQNTQLKVIYAEYFDAAQLIVGPTSRRTTSWPARRSATCRAPRRTSRSAAGWRSRG